MVRQLAWLVLLFATAGLPEQLTAEPPPGTCFALVDTPELPRPTALNCTGTPTGYQHRRLALRLPLPQAIAPQGMTLAVHQTRFQTMSIRFHYADGSTDTQSIQQGQFGNHWHVGGQISFASHPGRSVAEAWMFVDGLHSYDLLRIRLLPSAVASRQFEVGAVLIGAALALLAVVALYNLGAGFAVRQTFFVWHGSWAACVLFWGIVWSQLALGYYPQLAGTAASKTATILACLAVFFAALTAASALRPAIPRWASQSIILISLCVFVLGGLACLRGANLATLSLLLSIMTLATLVAVSVAIWWGWKSGKGEARDLAIAWCIPMIVLGATELFDFNTALLGGGAQIAVLFASAFQALCLSTLATLRFNSLRSERDLAVAAGIRLTELADRDGLTGLLNRRGFVGRCEAAFGELKNTPFALLVIDVDQFKNVNDRFGHEAGDRVLISLGGALRSLEQRYLCLAGRLGGEEFVLGVSGLPGSGLPEFAEAIRTTLRSCDHGEISRERPVTVSIGVATGVADGPFQILYGRADRALYDAKRSGRDKIIFASDMPEASDRQLPLPLL